MTIKLDYIVKNDVVFDLEDWFKVRLPETFEHREQAWTGYNSVDAYEDTEDQRKELAENIARYQDSGIVQWLGVVMGARVTIATTGTKPRKNWRSTSSTRRSGRPSRRLAITTR